MKVSVLTPVRSGGPYGWGKSLVECINGTGQHVASHVHDPFKVLSAPLRQSADVVHTSLPLSYRLWKKPVVMTVHGDYSVEDNIWKRFYPAAVGRANILTTPSRFLKERLGLDDAQVIPNAVFPERFPAPKRPDSRTINLVTVTKFYFEDKARGVLDLLRIVENVGKSFDGDLNLTVVGGGEYLTSVIRKASAFRVNVSFTGFVDHPSTELVSGDIFVYYSSHDNFPVTVLEAMASGLPVLVNDVGAMKEIITSGREGFVSDTDQEYIENLCSLLDDHILRQTMGARARAKVEEEFNWHRIAARYMTLYDSLQN